MADMNAGSQLIAIGLLVVFTAMVFEFFRHRLTAMSAGFGLVVFGFMLLFANSIRNRTSS